MNESERSEWTTSEDINGRMADHYYYYQCCGSGSEIRCFFDPWIRDPK
jgi:hypothetical protein